MVNFLEAFGEGAVIAITIKAIDEFSKELDNAEKGITGLSKRTEMLGAAFVTAGIAAVGVMGKLATEAAVAGDIQASFNKVVADDTVWKRMQDNVLGTVDKFKLMSVATTAVNRGIDKEFLPTLAKLAMKLKDSNPAFGDVTSIINDMSMALIRGNDRLLAQYGINVDLKKATEEYALSIGKEVKDLDESEKVTAAQIAIKQGLIDKNSQLADSTVDAADKMEQLNVKFNEAKIQIGEALAPAFSDLVDQIMPMIPQLTEIIISLMPLFIKGLEGATFVLGLAADGVTGLEAAFLALKIGIKGVVLVGVFLIKEFVHNIESMINMFVSGINTIINAYNAVAKKLKLGTIGTIGTVNLTSSIDKQFNDMLNSINSDVDSLTNLAKQPTVTKVGDAIIRPNGQIIRTDPNDTLIATKGGLGVNIYIENVNGLNPDEVAKSLNRLLRNKIAI